MTDIHANSLETQGSRQVTLTEVQQAIESLKRGKCLGLDMIPNEIFLKVDRQTQEIYTRVINQGCKLEDIPDTLLQKERKIERKKERKKERRKERKGLYKGKGMK